MNRAPSGRSPMRRRATKPNRSPSALARFRELQRVVLNLQRLPGSGAALEQARQELQNILPAAVDELSLGEGASRELALELLTRAVAKP